MWASQRKVLIHVCLTHFGPVSSFPDVLTFMEFDQNKGVGHPRHSEGKEAIWWTVRIRSSLPQKSFSKYGCLWICNATLCTRKDCDSVDHLRGNAHCPQFDCCLASSSLCSPRRDEDGHHFLPAVVVHRTGVFANAWSLANSPHQCDQWQTWTWPRTTALTSTQRPQRTSRSDHVFLHQRF